MDKKKQPRFKPTFWFYYLVGFVGAAAIGYYSHDILWWLYEVYAAATKQRP